MGRRGSLLKDTSLTHVSGGPHPRLLPGSWREWTACTMVSRRHLYTFEANSLQYFQGRLRPHADRHCCVQRNVMDRPSRKLKRSSSRRGKIL